MKLVLEVCPDFEASPLLRRIWCNPFHASIISIVEPPTYVGSWRGRGIKTDGGRPDMPHAAHDAGCLGAGAKMCCKLAPYSSLDLVLQVCFLTVCWFIG